MSMEEAYAQALWQMTERGMQPRVAVHALVESLEAHGRRSLLPRVARAFERLAEQQMRKNAVVVSVAHEKDTAHAKREAKAILPSLHLGTEEIAVVLDETLIGGWRLEGRGALVDNSFKKSLLEMYNRAVK